jgi:RecA-family ATPase
MSEIKTVNMSELRPSPVTWLWPNRIPRGKVTLLAGDPGVGKSFITCDIAARITLGGALGGDWPDGPTPLRAPGDVVFLSAEDDPADTIVPRLLAAGADLRRVRFAEGIDRPEERSMGLVELDRDCGAVARMLRSCERPRLIVIDPISAYLGRADGNSNTEVRAVLAGLARVAADTGAGVLCVTHLSKGGGAAQGAKVVYRAMGSLAFTAAARMVWYVSRLPADPDVRAMTLVKSNICAPGRGLTFTVAQGEQGPTLRWLSTDFEMAADEIEESAAEGGALREAAELLREVLSQGPVPAGEAIAQAVSAGISEATLKRARRSIGVRAVRAPGSDPSRPWMWTLAGAPATGPHDQERQRLIPRPGA